MTQKEELKTWRFHEFRRNMFLSERADWYKSYLPISVKGKVVLDVGAGDGETALFFLQNGAAKVICVENDKAALANLRYNARRHKGLEVIGEAFELEHLALVTPDGLVKIDIEGYEEILLSDAFPVNAYPTAMVVEVHGLQLRDRFEKAGWRIESRYKPLERSNHSCVYAYRGC